MRIYFIYVCNVSCSNVYLQSHIPRYFIADCFRGYPGQSCMFRHDKETLSAILTVCVGIRRSWVNAASKSRWCGTSMSSSKSHLYIFARIPEKIFDGQVTQFCKTKYYFIPVLHSVAPHCPFCSYLIIDNTSIFFGMSLCYCNLSFVIVYEG